MKRCRHQQTGPGYSGQRSGDVLRIEGLARPERRGGLQGGQEARLETVAVLCRHRRHDVLRHVRQAQRLGTGLHVGDQLTPGLALCLRPAGGA